MLPSAIAPLTAGLVATVRALIAAAAPTPERQTLDHLRADLSHEMAAKLARLSGYQREWREGRVHTDDELQAGALLDDIERLHLRHARTAAASFGSFAGLIRVLAHVANLRVTVTRATRGKRGTGDVGSTLERRLAALVVDSRALVESLSTRHATRFGELVTAAAEEIRREAATTDIHCVPVVIDSADGGAAMWVAASDAARWSDLLRNLIRNAVQATVERAPDAPRDDAGPGSALPPVTVRQRPAPGHGGAVVEISDEGVGMTSDRVETMWRDGNSSHGPGHGQGLTAAKHAFLSDRAGLEVRSLPGRGTCVRLELPARDITFRPPRTWAAPPLVVPALALAAALTFGALQLRHTEMVTVRVSDRHLVAALDKRGHVLWQHQMADRMLPNWRSTILADRESVSVEAPPLLLRDGNNRPLAIIATAPDQGPGRLIAFANDGRERWSRPLDWTAPRTTHTGNIISVFQAATVWNEGAQPAFVVNVRDGNWSSTSIQFLDPAGRLLGEYLHPGHLEFLASGDFDGDGRVEVVLNGKNNDAAHDPRFWAGEAPPDAHAEVLVMLETPGVGGQAFPYARWDGQPAATEKAYLLIPPLQAADFDDPNLTRVRRLAFGQTNDNGATRIEITLADGRLYVLDGRLRPLSCGVGDHTPAADLAPLRPAAPLLHFHAGRPEHIDLVVQRGS